MKLKLHKQQSRALISTATEMLYGGAAGGGKSHLIRVAMIVLCTEIPGFQAYLFRRLSDDLFKNHVIGPGGFFELLDEWMKAGLVKYNGSKNYFEFWNNARIWLCHCQHEKDKFKYQGAEIHFLGIDELTHFSESIYRYLRGRCRLGGLVIPEKYRGLLPRIICGSNPGGIGHTWVRRSFVKLQRAMHKMRMSKKEGGMVRQYVPARMDDNPTLLENDPEYINKLEGLGNAALVEAMKSGNWDIVAGGALDDLWDESKLVIPRSKIPQSWRIDRSFDWGSTAPFSVGWWAEATGEELTLSTGDVICPPRGTLIRVHEWYGSKEVGSNEGIKLGSEEVAEGIVKRESLLLNEKWIRNKPIPGPADSAIYSTQDQSELSIAAKMAKKQVRWSKANKGPGSRKNGLQLLRDRMSATIRGEGPGILFMDHCTATLDTLPVLPRDEKDPEDVDTGAEDHAYDEIRYKCLDRVILPPSDLTIGLPT